MSKKKPLRNFCQTLPSSRAAEIADTEIKWLNIPQKMVLDSMKSNDISIVIGSPGTGKTYLTVKHGLKELIKGNYDKLIFTRPAEEACGERIGFLPGNADQKIEPYMAPIFNILDEDIGPKERQDLMKHKIIQTIPLAYMRGITFKNSFVIGDEFQNTLPQQVRMFLTRFGEKSRVVITGDLRQSDYDIIRRPLNFKVNGLQDIVDRVRKFGVYAKGISVIELTRDNIVRHEVVKVVEEMYEDSMF